MRLKILKMKLQSQIRILSSIFSLASIVGISASLIVRGLESNLLLSDKIASVTSGLLVLSSGVICSLILNLLTKELIDENQTNELDKNEHLTKQIYRLNSQVVENNVTINKQKAEIEELENWIDTLMMLENSQYSVSGCRSCKHYHGKSYGVDKFIVCGMHPYGNSKCQDKELKENNYDS